MRATLALVAAGLLGACASGTAPSPEHADVVARLHEGVGLHASEGGTLAVTARRRVAGNEHSGRALLAVADTTGTFRFDPDELLWLEDLEVKLDDMVVWPGSVPMTLTDVTLTLVTPTPALPLYGSEESGTVTFTTPVDLRLTWAVLTDSGALAPLAPQRLGPFDLSATVEVNELGLVVGHLTVTAPGEVWSWADVLFLEKPELQVDFTDHPRAPRVE
jgi:hypothetical protein